MNELAVSLIIASVGILALAAAIALAAWRLSIAYRRLANEELKLDHNIGMIAARRRKDMAARQQQRKRATRLAA